MKRPNILWIFTDQHNARVAGFAGDPYAHTQHLDHLASQSVQFDNAVCSSPLCTPSRMSTLCSKEAHHCAAWSNHWIIFPEHVTWPAHFAAHGYRTCLVGKMHFGGRDQMNGFQYRPYGDLLHGLGHQPDPIRLFPGYAHVKSAGITEIPESMIQDVVVTRETLAFLLEHNDTQQDIPWFACASYGRPHSPFTAPGRYIRRYSDRLPQKRPHDIPKEPLEPYAQGFSRNHSRESIQRGLEAYYACVDFVDDCIGELLTGLGNAGMLENTIVIYTTDHGDMLNQFGCWGKAQYYDASIRVPLLISGPGIPKGGRVSHVISLMDLFPTTCGLTDLPIPEGLDGVDFSKIVHSPDAEECLRDFAPSASYRYGVRIQHNQTPEGKPCSAWNAVRERDWKYVEVEKGSSLLFDMVNDPNETTNLAGHPEHRSRCDRMRKKLYQNFSWEMVHQQLGEDKKRVPEFLSGRRPSTPNQYVLPDGRIFDAEGGLYDVRWLPIPPGCDGGIIPQQYG